MCSFVNTEDRYYRDNPSLKHNLSLSGCGFLGLYYVGVCFCIKKYAPQLYQNKPISGASAGALSAAFLICDIDLCDAVHHLCKLLVNVRKYTLGPFDPRCKMIEQVRETLDRLLPSDAHKICSGRLSISLTCYATGKNIIVRHFKDRNELINALLCTSHLLLFSGYLPLIFRGRAVYDGGFSNNLLCIDRDTITVCPLEGDADICPLNAPWGPNYYADQPTQYDDIMGRVTYSSMSFYLNWENIKRLTFMVWPMNSKRLANLAVQGYHDALRCLAIRGMSLTGTLVLLHIVDGYTNYPEDLSNVQCQV